MYGCRKSVSAKVRKENRHLRLKGIQTSYRHYKVCEQAEDEGWRGRLPTHPTPLPPPYTCNP